MCGGEWLYEEVMWVMVIDVLYDVYVVEKMFVS